MNKIVGVDGMRKESISLDLNIYDTPANVINLRIPRIVQEVSEEFHQRMIDAALHDSNVNRVEHEQCSRFTTCRRSEEMTVTNNNSSLHRLVPIANLAIALRNLQDYKGRMCCADSVGTDGHRSLEHIFDAIVRVDTTYIPENVTFKSDDIPYSFTCYEEVLDSLSNIGLRHLFNPVGDGSCLFGAVSAAYFGISTSKREQAKSTHALKVLMSLKIMENYDGARTEKERVDLKANILASLDYKVDSDRFIRLEREFFETTNGFTDFINGEYLHRSTEGGDAELVLLSSCLGVGIVLFDADKKIPMIDQGRRSMTRGGRLMDFLSMELFCPSTSQTQCANDVQLRHVEKGKSSCTTTTNSQQTIVLLRWKNHFTLLHVKDVRLFQDVLACRSLFKYILSCNATLCVYARKIVERFDRVDSIGDDVDDETDSLQVLISKFLSLFWDGLPLHLSSFILVWNDLTNNCKSRRISM